MTTSKIPLSLRGAGAIIVSNHGGRTLDILVSVISALPRIADTIGGDAPLLDSGIQRGTDVPKALALGARAVLIGRPYAMPLAAAGPLGAAHFTRLIVGELAVAMALTGTNSPEAVERSLLWQG
jgi:4-hydroxymandelate oxidase